VGGLDPSSLIEVYAYDYVSFGHVSFDYRPTVTAIVTDAVVYIDEC